MRPITFMVSELMDGSDAIGRDPQVRAAAKARLLLPLLEALCQEGESYLALHPDAPMLYQAGLRYAEEHTTETWVDLGVLLADRPAASLGSDCKDLACARVAELRARYGVPARPFVRWQVGRDGRTVFHVLVSRPRGGGPVAPPELLAAVGGVTEAAPDGQSVLEDPSRLLGMT